MKTEVASVAASLLWTLAVPLPAAAATAAVTFSGPGVSANLTLTYGTAVDAKYPDAFEVTAISGTFSDAAAGISNATVLGLVPITINTPEPDNLLAPHDFSRFPVASGLPHGVLSYDNLYWPGGAPQTASDYPAHGGFVDIYGLLFRIGDGRVVDFWSNGVFSGQPVGAIYGVAVATVDQALDYKDTGITAAAVPEPAGTALLLMGLGVTGLAAARRRSGTA